MAGKIELITGRFVGRVYGSIIGSKNRFFNPVFAFLSPLIVLLLRQCQLIDIKIFLQSHDLTGHAKNQRLLVSAVMIVQYQRSCRTTFAASPL
jgi:hypothetical protein